MTATNRRDQLFRFAQVGVSDRSGLEATCAVTYLGPCKKALPMPKNGGVRGDGTREELERIAKYTEDFLIVGLVERCGGTVHGALGRR